MCKIHEIPYKFVNRHPPNVSRPVSWNLNLASARNLRLGALVLLLITINQVDEPLLEPTLGEAFIYWAIRPLVLAIGLWLADALVNRYFADRWNNPEWLKPVVLVSLIGLIPLAITEAVMELHLPFRPEFVDDELWAVSPMLAYLGELATLATIVVPLHLLLWLIIDRRQPTENVSKAETPQPEFLKRSSNSSVDDVLALRAEEHYVRIYAAADSELVHYRFGDAVAELPESLGLQVHRSWWVAEKAVVSASRGDRRWELRLVNDVAVPVSDSYVATVRERGWLKKKARK